MPWKSRQQLRQDAALERARPINTTNVVRISDLYNGPLDDDNDEGPDAA